MPRKHKKVRRWVQEEKFLCGCLLETRVQRDNYETCVGEALPGWASIANYEFNPLGRI